MTPYHALRKHGSAKRGRRARNWWLETFFFPQPLVYYSISITRGRCSDLTIHKLIVVMRYTCNVRMKMEWRGSKLGALQKLLERVLKVWELWKEKRSKKLDFISWDSFKDSVCDRYNRIMHMEYLKHDDAISKRISEARN